MKPVNRVGHIDVVRGIAIIGVVFLHSSFESRFDEPTLVICAYLERLFDWVVLAFFFLSGLLQDDRQELGLFLKRRFKSLMIPFFACNLFYNLAFVILEVLTGRQFGGHEWGPALLLLGWFHSPAFQLYFLPYLFGIAVVVFLMSKVISHRGRLLLLLISLATTVTFYQNVGWPVSSHGAQTIKLPLYFAAFLMGVVGRPFMLGAPSFMLVLPLVIWVALALILQQQCMLSLLIPPLLYLGTNMVHELWNAKLLQRIGRSSAAIYLWHTPILLPAFTTVFAILHVPAPINLGLSVVLTISVCAWPIQAWSSKATKAWRIKKG